MCSNIRLGEKMNTLDKEMKILYSLCEKVKRIENFDKHAILENKISLLTEALDQRDLDRTRSVITNFQKTLTDLEASLKTLQGELDTDQTAAAKSDATPFFEYMSDMKEVVSELLSALADKEFESGKIMSYLGTKISLPQMIGVATDAASRMTAFFKAYNAFKQKFTKAIIGLPDVKDDKSIEAQRKDLAKLPKIEKVEDFASEMFKDATGGGIGKKIKSFFGSLFTFGSASKALDKFPKADADDLGIAITALFMNSRVGAIKGLKMPPLPPMSDLKNASEDAKEEKPEESGEVDISKIVGSDSLVTVDNVSYRRGTRSGRWYNSDEFDNNKKIIVIKDQELLDKLDAALKQKVSSGNASDEEPSELPKSDNSVSDDDKQKLKAILDTLSPDVQKSIKGLIGDAYKRKSAVISEELLTSNRQKRIPPKSEKSKNKEVNRWMSLAGIK